MCVLLVTLGADVHRLNEDGDMPLHRALAWLGRQVKKAEKDRTRVADRKGGGHRLWGAAAGHLGRRGPTGTVIALSGVPERGVRQLDDCRAVVLCFLAAGVSVRGLGDAAGAPPERPVAVPAHHPGRRRLWAAAVEYARLAISGRVRRRAADEGPPTRLRGCAPTGGRAADATGGTLAVG